MRAMFKPAGANLNDPTLAFKAASRGMQSNTRTVTKADQEIVRPNLTRTTTTNTSTSGSGGGSGGATEEKIEELPRESAPDIRIHTAECSRQWLALSEEQRADLGVQDRYCRQNVGCCTPEQAARVTGAKTEAELRLENCERLIAALTPAQLNDSAYMLTFAAANPSCVNQETKEQAGARLWTAFLNGRAPTIALEDEFCRAQGTYCNPAQLARIAPQQRDPAQCNVPASFPTEAAKQAFIAANPTCNAANVPVTTPRNDVANEEEKDYTLYYIAGGAALAIVLASTAAYFALRDTSEE